MTAENPGKFVVKLTAKERVAFALVRDVIQREDGKFILAPYNWHVARQVVRYFLGEVE